MLHKVLRSLIRWLVVVVLLVGFCYYGNYHLVVTNYTIESEKLPEEFDGFKIVQISDFHNETFGKNNKGLIEKIQNQNPDIIVVTGDLVDSNRTDIPIAVSFLEEASKICPVYYVTGNHECSLPWNTIQDMLGQFEDAGAILMLDRVIEIERNGDSFLLIGLDEGSSYGNTLLEITKDLDENQFKILLSHKPHIIEKYAQSGVDLVFSGHAHGGQFRMPFFGPVYSPGQGFRPKLTSGVHERESTKMVISRGMGNSVIPVRLFNEPEIVVVTLKRL